MRDVGRRIRSAVVSCGLALVVTVMPLEAQDDSLPARLAPATRAAIARLVDSVRTAGLPVAPLYSKTREGVAKNVDDERILAAVRTLSRDLQRSREAMGDDDASRAEIVAGASALSAGVRPATLRRLRGDARARPGGSAAVALVVIADLVTRGVRPNVAAQTVESLHARGVGDALLYTLRRSVEQDISAGLSPATALADRERMVLELSGTRVPRPPRP